MHVAKSSSQQNNQTSENETHGENAALVVGDMRFNQNVNNTRNSRFNGCLSGSLKIKCVQKILIRYSASYFK
jgi:hypothetical protein